MELKEVWKDRKLKGVLVKVVDNPAMAVIAQQCGMDFVLFGPKVSSDLEAQGLP